MNNVIKGLFISFIFVGILMLFYHNYKDKEDQKLAAYIKDVCLKPYPMLSNCDIHTRFVTFPKDHNATLNGITCDSIFTGFPNSKHKAILTLGWYGNETCVGWSIDKLGD